MILYPGPYSFLLWRETEEVHQPLPTGHTAIYPLTALIPLDYLTDRSVLGHLCIYNFITPNLPSVYLSDCQPTWAVSTILLFTQLEDPVQKSLVDGSVKGQNTTRELNREYVQYWIQKWYKNLQAMEENGEKRKRKAQEEIRNFPFCYIKGEREREGENVSICIFRVSEISCKRSLNVKGRMNTNFSIISHIIHKS